MKFEPVPLLEAEGKILGHNIGAANAKISYAIAHQRSHGEMNYARHPA